MATKKGNDGGWEPLVGTADTDTAGLWLEVPAGLAVLALQLRHSFAIARGKHPRGVLWTLLALAVLVYLPLPWFGWSWVAMQACLLASAPMVLRRWRLAVALAAPILGTDLAPVALFAGLQPARTLLYGVCYQTFTLVALAAALYGSARLVRMLDELHATRVELAELAVGRERLRVSHDLHDLPPAVEAVLAWAVREGVTNVPRHSQASTCQITAGRHDGDVWLEIGNDGVRTPAGAGSGSGLAGLAERARALGGSVAAKRTRDGRFRLLVQVPEVPEEDA
jgi:signal transduction histidine kinase